MGVKRHLYQGEMLTSLKVCGLIAFQLLNHLLSKDGQFCLLGALHQRCQGTFSCGLLYITAIFCVLDKALSRASQIACSQRQEFSQETQTQQKFV